MARGTRLEQETSLAYSSEAKRESTFQCQRDIRFTLMRMNWIKSRHLSENLEKTLVLIKYALFLFPDRSQ